MSKHEEWFRHDFNFLDSKNMHSVLDCCGYAGVYAYVRLLEIFADHFDPKSPEIFEESKRHVFSSIFPKTTQKTGKKILENLQKLGLFSYKIEGKRIIFNCSFFKGRKTLLRKK